MTNKIVVLGAFIGLALFLAFGFLPAALYGGYAGLMMATGLTGGAVAPTLVVRALVVFGMVLGVTAIAFLSTVLGAAGGAGVSAAIRGVKTGCK